MFTIYRFILLYIYYYIQKKILPIYIQPKKTSEEVFFVYKGIRICSLILHGRNRKDRYLFGL